MFEHLKRIKDGWYDGEGKEVNLKKLEWLETNFDISLLPEIITPTIEGNVYLEWPYHTLGDISAEIDITNKTAAVHVLYFTDVEYTQTFDLSLTFTKFNEYIRTYISDMTHRLKLKNTHEC